jgi:hypothetical protein
VLSSTGSVPGPPSRTCGHLPGDCRVVVLGTDPGNKVGWTVLPSLGIVALLIFYVIVPLAPGRIWKRVGSQFEMRTLEVSE